MTPQNMSLAVPALLAACIWAVVFIARPDSGFDLTADRAAALCVSVAVYVSLLAAFIQECSTTRYGAPGFFSEFVSDSEAHAIVTVAYLTIFASALGAVLVRVTGRTGRRGFPVHSLLWLPYMGAWVLGSLLGRYPGALTSAWVSLAALVPIALLPGGPRNPTVKRTAYITLRVTVCASLVLGFLYVSRAWAPYGVWPGGWRVDLPRLQGFLPQPNVLGWISAVAILLEVRGPKSTGRFPFAALAGIALVLSGSRSPVIALVLAILLTRFHRSRRFVLPSGVRRVMMLIIGGVLIYEVLSSAQNLNSVNGRAITWSQAWTVFIHNPLVGTGPGAYLQNVGIQEAVPYAHSQILQTAAELGVVGLVALVIHVGALVVIVRSRKDRSLIAPAATMWLVMFLPETLLRFTSVGFVLPVLVFGLLVHVAIQGAPTPASGGLVVNEFAPDRRTSSEGEAIGEGPWREFRVPQGSRPRAS
jgi:O-antigen ligase